MKKLTGSQLINFLATAAEVLRDCDLAEELSHIQEEYSDELDNALVAAMDVGLSKPTVRS